MNSRRRFLLTSALHSPEKFYAALAGRLRKPTATLTGGGVSAALITRVGAPQRSALIKSQ
jgi:hypothetical protein